MIQKSSFLVWTIQITSQSLVAVVPRQGGILALAFAILLTFTHVGVGGGGVSGLGAISSSGATSGLSANILSKSICSHKEDYRYAE